MEYGVSGLKHLHARGHSHFILTVQGCPQNCLWCCVPHTIPLPADPPDVSALSEYILALAAKAGSEKKSIMISGGEPLFYGNFMTDLCARLKGKDFTINIMTSGNAPFNILAGCAKLCAHIFYDIKSLDYGKHRLFTGQGNNRILENLQMLAKKPFSSRCGITVRTPIASGFNDSAEDISRIASFLNGLKIDQWSLVFVRERKNPHGMSPDAGLFRRLQLLAGELSRHFRESIHDDQAFTIHFREKT